VGQGLENVGDRDKRGGEIKDMRSEMWDQGHWDLKLGMLRSTIRYAGI